MKRFEIKSANLIENIYFHVIFNKFIYFKK